PLIPLMRGGGEIGTIEEWKRCAAAEPEGPRRSDYAGLALVFAELAGVGGVRRAALEGWNVLQSQQVQEWQNMAREPPTPQVLLRLLQLRFPVPLPQDLQTAIQETTDLHTLSRWFDVAATAPSLDAFRAAIQDGEHP